MIRENIFVNLSELLEIISVNTDKYFRQCSTEDQIKYLVEYGAVNLYECVMADRKTENDPEKPNNSERSRR